MKILIVKAKKEGGNPKDYPYWDELVSRLDSPTVIETPVSFAMLKDELDRCDVWISVDSFFQHFNENFRQKHGIVLWGPSDPKIYGYDTNMNLTAKEPKLRKDQFGMWHDFKEETTFPTVEEVMDAIHEAYPD